MPDHRCFVVDSRVPREWFLVAPFRFELQERLSLRTRFPNFFRNNPVADAMVGTKWALVSRDDPGGLSGRILPGEKLRFGVTNLTCEAAAGTACGERLWELGEPPVSLCVYEVLSTNTYTGAALGSLERGTSWCWLPRASSVGLPTATSVRLTISRQRRLTGASHKGRCGIFAFFVASDEPKA